MNYELYQKKYQFERLINVLQNNYNNLLENEFALVKVLIYHAYEPP